MVPVTLVDYSSVTPERTDVIEVKEGGGQFLERGRAERLAFEGQAALVAA